MRSSSNVLAGAALAVLAACGGRNKEETLAAWDETLPAPGTAGEGVGADEMGNVVEEEGEFHLKILRSYGDDKEGKLLLLAETAQPPRDDVIAAIQPGAGAQSIGAEVGQPLWWYASFDGIRVPWAVTSDAIAYYVGVIDSFREGDFGPSAGVAMQKAALTYEADIKRVSHIEMEGKAFDDVYVAHLVLGWSQYCGSECAMAFFKERTVVLTDSGNVLAIFGDGKTKYVVS